MELGARELFFIINEKNDEEVLQKSTKRSTFASVLRKGLTNAVIS